MEEKAIELLKLKGEETEALLNQSSDVPLIQVKQVPSRFKGYPKDTVISYEPIKMKELEILNTDENLDASYAIAMLLDAIHCNTLNAEDLYFYDVMYVGILRKIQSFGQTKGMLKRRCPKCGGWVKKVYDYTEIDFKDMLAPDLPMKMEVCGKQLEFSQISMKEFLQIQENDGMLGVYSRYIKNLPLEEAEELVNNAYGVDIKKLNFVDKQLDYGMKPFIVTCNNQVYNPQTNKMEVCGEQVVLEVTSPFEVLFPEDAITEDTGFDVQYG